jgi:hypothetical protein
MEGWKAFRNQSQDRYFGWTVVRNFGLDLLDLLDFLRLLHLVTINNLAF